MKIYGMGASRSFRAVWAACEAGIEIDYIELSFGPDKLRGTAGSEYRALNSQGKFPTLIDEGRVITESGAIVNYLASYSDKTLVPEDGSFERAQYDQMCFFILTELEQPLWSKGKHSFALPEEYRIPELIDRTLPFEFEKAQKALLKLLDNSGFAVSNKFTMADILLAQTISWAHHFKFQVNEQLLTYKDAMYKRDACQEARRIVSPKK